MTQKERPIPPPPPIPVKVPEEEEAPVEEPVIKETEKKQTEKPNQQCIWRKTSPTNTTFEVRDFLFLPVSWLFSFEIIQIRQLYDTLPFDDVNGGVWKQGFDITYNPSQWTSSKKLKVILMPHSHCDPGKTKLDHVQDQNDLFLRNIFRLVTNIRRIFFTCNEIYS